MLSKRVLFIFTFIIQISIVGCSKCGDNDKMIGEYTTEKKGIAIRDSTKGESARSYLKINSDNTFSLFDEENRNRLNGKWKIVSCETVENNLRERVPESVLEFEIENKKTKAKYRDGRLEFEYPEDFYDGRYKSLWYVKVNRER